MDQTWGKILAPCDSVCSTKSYCRKLLRKKHYKLPKSLPFSSFDNHPHTSLKVPEISAELIKVLTLPHVSIIFSVGALVVPEQIYPEV